MRIAIVEDQLSYVKVLQGYLERYAKEHNVEIESRLFSNGMEIAEEYQPVWDLILMDIDMPLLDGMSAARTIRKKDDTVLIIFITNMAQYAIAGYEVQALDYVLKPVQYPSFALKLRRAIKILEARPRDSLILAKEGETVKIWVQDLCYVEVFDHKLLYHTLDGEYTAFDTLGNLEKRLGPGFARCNRSYLVNLRFVNAVQGDTLLIGGHTLKIGRTKKKEFMQQLSEYYQNGGR